MSDEARIKSTDFTGRSTNGRSTAFDAVSPGSNPGRPAKSRRSGTKRTAAGASSNIGFFGGSKHCRGSWTDFGVLQRPPQKAWFVEVQKHEV